MPQPSRFDVAPDPLKSAVFLDFDGVLVDIANGPDEIAVSEGLSHLLRRLERATGGATGIITGRSIEDLRGHLAEPPSWLAGSHGGERMTPRGIWTHPLVGSGDVAKVRAAVNALEAFGEGVLAEDKPLGAVIHYRQASQLEDALRRAAETIAADHSGFECHAAKMAFEVKPAEVGKAHVVAEWRGHAPFVGRVPIYIGDDLTDEAAMQHVQDAGGVAIKVGAGDSVAAHRLDSVADVHDGLAGWMDRAEAKAPA